MGIRVRNVLISSCDDKSGSVIATAQLRLISRHLTRQSQPHQLHTPSHIAPHFIRGKEHHNRYKGCLCMGWK
ncbi:hypothetical protein LY76DRAFT_384094 [Colletotrichum caudatum]|nr:hypothetical protein LY76DRAFT_384094 [Colletotrichum caudatum]